MTVLDWIIRYWVQWLFGLIGAALLAGYRRLAKQEKERKAIKAGLLAILHDRLYTECSRCLAQGSIDTDAMRNLEYLYRSYHALGGNGTGTELYNRAKALPIKND